MEEIFDVDGSDLVDYDIEADENGVMTDVSQTILKKSKDKLCRQTPITILITPKPAKQADMFVSLKVRFAESVEYEYTSAESGASGLSPVREIHKFDGAFFSLKIYDQ